MKTYLAEDYEQMSAKAAEIIKEQLVNKPSLTLGLATGATPLGLYKKLISEYQKEQLSFHDVKTVNLDEYLGLSKNDVNSYYHFMYENFFRHININPNHTHIPNGMTEDPQQECKQYEQMIQSIGGIDLQVLGIGLNGHIGFNEPGSSFDCSTHIVQLDKSTRQANARFFPAIEDVPTEAITMGIKTIMNARQIILLASGAKKAEAVRRLMEGKVEAQFPASVLQLHPNVCIILDKDAASLLRERSTSL